MRNPSRRSKVAMKRHGNLKVELQTSVIKLTDYPNIGYVGTHQFRVQTLVCGRENGNLKVELNSELLVTHHSSC